MDEALVLKAAKAVEHGNTAGVHFVIHLLDLGLAYCNMASNADTKPNARRHEANANRCYQSAIFHVHELSLTRTEQMAFDQREMRLRARLAGLVSNHLAEPAHGLTFPQVFAPRPAEELANVQILREKFKNVPNLTASLNIPERRRIIPENP